MRRDLTVPEKKWKNLDDATLAEVNLITFYGHHEILSPKLGPLMARFACHHSYFY